ncbi:hypothetical protein M514_25574 [Trichuris suis]|uniref:Uncharacterized protein n=1 Tax=Trichuris suis TaxID=68888 RepID=A0A085MYG5_9BILA|nr:hypothetical protein M514_25574 [Trichuris suis]
MAIPVDAVQRFPNVVGLLQKALVGHQQITNCRSHKAHGFAQIKERASWHHSKTRLRLRAKRRAFLKDAKP